ncbi:hypothetical protein [Microbulbifer magnicolonia]|uniref:hypothetical protein n=1 Tax=Microbulbifer magnicolonia TaxID=3109744 RepID=UPI002B408735|nr:hypothetical protein [Microbulbifer sp. GG15]
MDTSVALVSAYLQVNGYFCITEYPLLESSRGEITTVSDLDVLAFRFPGAGREVRLHKHDKIVGDTRFEPDPALDSPTDQPDMIVGEVKRGRARFNSAARRPEVLAAALMRFGCCEPKHAHSLAQKLVHSGEETSARGHIVRMIAFGGIEPEQPPPHWHVVSLETIVDCLQKHLHDNWNLMRQVRFSNDALDLLSLLERARSRRPQRPQPQRGRKK